jgi:hypothetical protein
MLLDKFRLRGIIREQRTLERNKMNTFFKVQYKGVGGKGFCYYVKNPSFDNYGVGGTFIYQRGKHLDDKVLGPGKWLINEIGKIELVTNSRTIKELEKLFK